MYFKWFSSSGKEWGKQLSIGQKLWKGGHLRFPVVHHPPQPCRQRYKAVLVSSQGFDLICHPLKVHALTITTLPLHWLLWVLGNNHKYPYHLSIHLSMKAGNRFFLPFQLIDAMHKKENNVDLISSKAISRHFWSKKKITRDCLAFGITGHLCSWGDVITTTAIMLQARPFWENIYRAMCLFSLPVKKSTGASHVIHHSW